MGRQARAEQEHQEAKMEQEEGRSDPIEREEGMLEWGEGNFLRTPVKALLGSW